MELARGYVDSVQVCKTEPNKIEAIWVVFNDSDVGKLLRFDERNLEKQHRPANEKAVPILKIKKTFI